MGNLVLAGRYEIIEKIGEGGMAVVYKARDRLLSRFVAIKILKKEFVSDTTFIENFRRESKAAASLLHPNIVTIYDVGKDRDVHYIVMEYVEGCTLSDVVAAEAPLDYKRCISVAKQVASALSLAHRNNIIHRDVKPHNVLITQDGTAKITDFGIAKAVTDKTIISENGVIMGSVHYFSPEQSRGQYVDEKSDIYSLGIVLYEMLTGRVPFDADNPVTIAVMHINDTVIPPSRIVRGIPPGLDQIVVKATAKFQVDRFRNIDEMYKALDNVNFITGVIDDPEIAGFVAPTNTRPETLAHGNGFAIPAQEAPYARDGLEDRYYGYERDVDDPDDYDAYDDDEDDAGQAGRLGGRKPGSGRNTGRGGRRPVSGGGRGRNGKKKKDDMPFKWKALLVVAAIAVAILISIPLSGAAAMLLSTRAATVPNVLGMEEETATETLEADGFKYDIDYVSEPPKTVDGFTVAEEYAPGQVVKQDPAGDSKAKKGSTVKITVLSAETAAPKEEEKKEEEEAAPVEKAVPNVVGKARAAAETEINAAGFAVGDTTARNSDSPVGTVIEQTPKSGEMLQTGKKVSIVLSSGPRAKTTTVPEIIGTSVETARGILAGSNLELGMITYDYSSEFAADVIMSNNPAQGAVLEEGQAVSVVVCLGASPTIPPFTGMDLDNYMALLNSWRLVGNPQAEYSNTVPAGFVVRVDPAPYAAVAVGSTVNVYVSLGPQTPLPDDGTGGAGATGGADGAGPAGGGTP